MFESRFRHEKKVPKKFARSSNHQKSELLKAEVSFPSQSDEE